jgi:hypothetical protein
MKKIWVIASILLLVAGTAMADPITGSNSPLSRPFVPDPGSPPPNLQIILDNIFGPGVLNAITDQSLTAVWGAVGIPPFSNINPVLAFEFTSGPANNDLQEFGMWTAHDTGGPIIRHPIFLGPAEGANDPTGPTLATVQWLTPTSGAIISAALPGYVNTGPFAGIEYGWFGFYYRFSTAAFEYTYDALNPGGVVAALAYEVPGGAAWAVAFDGDLNHPVWDFNDMVVKIESIHPAVPEPGILILLGIGLSAVGILSRRIKL